jgi:hypothetical protein
LGLADVVVRIVPGDQTFVVKRGAGVLVGRCIGIDEDSAARITVNPYLPPVEEAVFLGRAPGSVGFDLEVVVLVVLTDGV